MPKPKEHKDTVTYPPSKRKAPPFKPQRPSKLPRTATTDSERSDTANKIPEASGRAGAAASRAKGSSKRQTTSAKAASESASSRKRLQPLELISDSDDDLDESCDNALTAVASKTTRNPPRHIDDALLNVLTDDDEQPIQEEVLAPDIDENATIPQALLLRLLHENFESKNTKIDKHAVVVLRKYIDVFVRETIARATLSKKDDVEDGKASQSDANWLDRQDLEKVAGGMLMDF